MGKNPVVAIIAVIILIVAIVMIARSMSGGSGSADYGELFWYDTGSKQLYAGPHEMPPIKAPSGSEGVQAYVFAKSSCDNASDRFIVYLEKFPNKKAIMNASGMEERNALMAKRLIRRENDAEWVEANSDEGAAITAEVMAARETGVLCAEYRK